MNLNLIQKSCSMMQLALKQPILLLLLGFIIACSGTQRYDHSSVSNDHQPSDPKVKQPDTQEKQYYIRDHSNNTTGSINLDLPVRIQWHETSLTRVVKDDKSKYRNENNRNLYEIKYSDDGFKLRDPNGQLLWKLKYKESRLKIAENEEMTQAYEIRQNGQEVEIKKEEKVLQSIDLGSASVPVLIKTNRESLMVSGPTKNYSFAILAIEEIPADQQLILISEVLLSGK
jgi:hypothetical protein